MSMKKKLAGLAFGLTVFCLASRTSDVVAMPSQSVVVFYFSDAAHTTVVGEKNIDCFGFQSNWGVMTAYQSRQTEPCGAACSPYPSC